MKYRFSTATGTVLLEGEAEMVEIRRTGQQLAKDKGVDVRVHIGPNYRGLLELVGTWRPDGLHRNTFGQLERLDPDGRNFSHVRDESR